jgi:3-hydroxybutyryl-CoA dehydrogenase
VTFATALVAGTGTMGQGIAQVLAEAGLTVYLFDTSPEALGAAVQAVRGRLSRRVERGDLQMDLGRIETQLRPADTLDGLDDVDLAIESVPEKIDVKTAVFRALDGALPPAAVIATNTSGLDVAALAAATQRPELVVGLHFFNPPPANPLIEVVAAPQTASTVLAAVHGLAHRCGKTPIDVGNRPGFVVNRLLFAMIVEAMRALDDGVASAEDIDRALRLAAGHAIGPLALADFIGLDVCLDILESLDQRLGARFSPPDSLRQLVGAGHLGRKAQRGFFPY